MSGSNVDQPNPNPNSVPETEADSGEVPSQQSTPAAEAEPVISLVMPTMNEADGVAECIEQANEAFEELGATGEIIVSDSSDDRTPEIAREMGATVVEPDELGYGSAYRHAFEHARGRYVVIGDADTTYDFTELPKLLEPILREEADIVLGSRLEGDIEPGAMPPLHRFVGNPLLTKFLNFFYDAGVSDAHSGFRVITRDALEQLELESSGMEFASEMIMAAGAKGLRIEEVPITYSTREGDATLDSFSDGWRHVKFMLLNVPGHLFSMPALVLGTLGVLILGVSLAGIEVAGARFGVNSMIAGSLLAVVGYQVEMLAIFSSIATNPIRQPEDPVTYYIDRHFRLEHGALAGLLFSAFGVAVGAYLIGNWLTSGFADVPNTKVSVLAFTALVLGLQTVFNSFFIGSISE
jgi:hypothetical protein